MRRLLLCLLLCGLPLSQAVSKDISVIATFGDSLFSGFGIAAKDNLPTQLEGRLWKDGKKVRVINDGVAGDTTADGLSRLDDLLSQKPDLVIVELGGNDMLHGVPPSDTRYNLDKILLRISNANIKILVVGQLAQHSMGEAYAKDFNPLFCELAKKYAAPCYPFLLNGIYDKPELLQEDGIHPNAKGVLALLDNLYAPITDLMKY
jgi:acyl-CoA thioesterase-1